MKLDITITKVLSKSAPRRDTRRIGTIVLNFVDRNHEDTVKKSYIQVVGSSIVREKEINGG